MQYRNFQPNDVSATRKTITGILPVAAVMGMIVNRNSTTTDTSDVLQLSTGRAGYFLRRDVVTVAARKAWLDADELRPNKGGFEVPYVIDGAVTAEDFDEVWVEGSALLDASMDAATAVGANVTSSAGKFAEVTNLATQDILGVVQVNEAALNGGGGRRFLIRVTRSQHQAVAP